jgi:hypothetical protein
LAQASVFRSTWFWLLTLTEALPPSEVRCSKSFSASTPVPFIKWLGFLGLLSRACSTDAVPPALPPSRQCHRDPLMDRATALAPEIRHAVNIIVHINDSPTAVTVFVGSAASTAYPSTIPSEGE